MRWLLLGALALAALAAGGAWLSLDWLLRRAILAYGPNVTGTPVEVGLVNVFPFTGRGRLRRLRIGNPPGFASPHALRLRSLRVRLEPRSLLRDRVVIHEVLVDGPELFYERKDGGSNLDLLRRNAQAYSGGAKPPAAGPGQPSPAKPSPGGSRVRAQAGRARTVVIERLRVTNGKVFVTTRLTGSKAVEVPLPAIELRDIGNKPGGASLAEAGSQVLAAMLDSALKAVAKSGLDKAVEQGKKAVLDGISQGIKRLFGGK